MRDEIRVPWNASWTGELHFEIRPCRYAGGKKAIWQRHAPGEGRPLFAKPHHVRQRKSIAEMRCTVCGDRTPENDRWWFRLGNVIDGYFMTTEAPVHHDCGVIAMGLCPHLKTLTPVFEPFPRNSKLICAIMGGVKPEGEQYGLKTSPHEKIIGALKLGWPLSMCKFVK